MQTRLVGNTHLVAGNADTIPQVLELLQNEGVEVKNNPDVYIREYQGFGIDEARELRERASLRAMGSHRIFIVATSSMTNEAQNALLKTLEEPSANAQFFFIVPAPHMLLPTLRSRAQMLRIVGVDVHTEILDLKTFLAATPQKRLDMLKPLLEKDENEKRDLTKILTFLSSLEKRLEKNPDGLRTVYRARKYIGDKGALVKPLLEQVALLIPQV